MPSKWTKPYAEKYDTSERTILRIKADGIDVDDVEAVEAWLASRENRSRAKTKAGASKGAKGSRAPHKTAVEALQGAQHALRRLEGEESRLYQEMMAAGDKLILQAERRKAWLATLNELKKFDMLVEAGRRDTGETVTRAQLQPVLAALAVWLRRGNEDFLNSICLQIAEADTPQKVYEAVAPSIRQCVGNAVDAATNDGRLPGWVREALVSGL